VEIDDLHASLQRVDTGFKRRRRSQCALVLVEEHDLTGAGSSNASENSSRRSCAGPQATASTRTGRRLDWISLRTSRLTRSLRWRTAQEGGSDRRQG